MKAQIHNYSCWIDETDPVELYDTFMVRLNEAGFGVENVIERHFTPQGYIVLFLLAESHLAIHTFPEQNTTHIELSSCVKKPFDKFIKMIND